MGRPRRRAADGSRVRGLGPRRRTRRALAGGGVGPARRLNEALAGWSGVTITPMFGRWGYFTEGRLFACFPLRAKDRDLWIRLGAEDQRRALAQGGVRPHRRFARRGWVELDIEVPRDIERALRWLRRGWEAAMRREEESDG